MDRIQNGTNNKTWPSKYAYRSMAIIHEAQIEESPTLMTSRIRHGLSRTGYPALFGRAFSVHNYTDTLYIVAPPKLCLYLSLDLCMLLLHILANCQNNRKGHAVQN